MKRFKLLQILIIVTSLLISSCDKNQQEEINNPDYLSTELTYTIVGTRQTTFYSNNAIIIAPSVGEPFYGQDASYSSNEPSYTDNGDGTISDNVTALMWQKDMGEKLSYSDAVAKASSMNLGGYNDWRIPTIKELYSLILFTGQVSGANPIKPFIDTQFFIQPHGEPDLGERLIDAQTWTSTKYTSLVMNGQECIFGVNFVDGRIKGYPMQKNSTQQPHAMVDNKMYFRMVRGNTEYGKNNFVDNQDGTISDLATGLMWQNKDDGIGRDWENALSYAENLIYAGYNDWRLPNAKELHSIVDYSRSLDFTSSPAINPLFSISLISYSDGTPENYPYIWTSTTHLDSPSPYNPAVYIAFGKALGKMSFGNSGELVYDVHGAGAQRSDPKNGNLNDYPQ